MPAHHQTFKSTTSAALLMHRLPYGVLQRRWFTNAVGGNTITVTAGLGGLVYIYTTWVRQHRRSLAQT
jgi:hypothetical protein